MAVGLPMKTTYANGDVLSASDVNDITGTINANVNPYTAGKNQIINGDYGVNQRNFSTSTTDLAYLFDRWRHTYLGGSLTSTAQTFSPGNAITGYEPKNYLQSVTASQATTTYAAILYAGIEDVRILAGQTATISFWAKAASGTPAVGIEIQQNFGTGGSGAVVTSVAAKTLSTSWTRYTATIAVPSITGKTIGTGSNLGLNLWISAGATSGVASRASNIGAQNATFQFWGVQVEAGSTATAFQTATGTIQGELAACQRYYQFIGGTASGFPIVGGYTSTATTNRYPIVFPVQMRISPTITKNGTWNVANTGQPVVGMSNTQGFSIESLGTALGNSYIYPDSTDDTFTMSAEL
jgi:hypothetical protein